MVAAQVPTFDFWWAALEKQRSARTGSLIIPTCAKRCSSDGQVVKASASEAVDSGLILSGIEPMTLKLMFTASLIDD